MRTVIYRLMAKSTYLADKLGKYEGIRELIKVCGRAKQANKNRLIVPLSFRSGVDITDTS
jgi:hypothetical protein